MFGVVISFSWPKELFGIRSQARERAPEVWGREGGNSFRVEGTCLARKER